MTTRANYLDGVYVGDFGYTITITLKDEDGTVQNVSTYSTSQTIYLRSPDGSKEVTCTGSFNTDGSDGKIDFAFASGDIDRPGLWKAQVVLFLTATKQKAAYFEINVKTRLGS